MARGWIDVEIMRLMNCRTLTRLRSSDDPGPESSLVKPLWASLTQRLHDPALGLSREAAQLVSGPHALGALYFSQSDASKLEIPPPIRTIFNIGDPTALAPHECAMVFIFGVGADTDANRVVAFHIVDVNGARVPSLDNATSFLPGTVFKTSQGGTIGFGEVCNPTDSPKDLPQGWKVITRIL